jgi:hypothetical protein
MKRERDYRAGSSRLPGHTDPKRPKDTIPAVLSPDEAVLNAPAAAMLGRDKIKQLNAAGNASRGTDSHGKPIEHGRSGLDAAMGEHADRLHPVGRNG